MKFIKKIVYLGFLLFVLLQMSLSYIYQWSHIPTSTVSQEVHKSKSTVTVTEIRPVKTSLLIGTDGFALAESVREVCKSLSEPKLNAVNGMHYTADGKVKLCPMEKIGSTYWRRVFFLATSKDSKFKQPYDIQPGLAISRRQGFNYEKNRNATEFSFLFVRDPFSRLLSTFIDKLVAPNPTFWHLFGTQAVHKYRSPLHTTKGKLYGHDVTFTEFVKFATDMEVTSSIKKNGHIYSIKHGCQPCQQSYTFVGRMEQFKDDAFYVMKKMGLEDVVKSINSTFIALTEDDAMTDSIRDPISRWKGSIIRYITWDKALRRLWLKLQMRGLISKDIDLSLSEATIKTMTTNKFIALARKAHSESDPVKLKQQKEVVKKEAFASVPLSVLKKFASAFRDDFVMFGYDQFPSKYFDRAEEPTPPSSFFNYTHLN